MEKYLISSCATPHKRSLSRLWFEFIFNIFINDVIECLDTEETHSQVISNLRVLGLLFADDFAVTSFTSYRLQKKRILN
jgi:hypothetical protein